MQVRILPPEINEPEETYRSQIEAIAKKYKLSHEQYITICNFIYKESISAIKLVDWTNKNFGITITTVDAQDFIASYEDMIYSIYYKEGEERIYGSDIPLNVAYMKFIKLPTFSKEFESLQIQTKKIINEKMKFYGFD